jgi:hypothetical protein
MGGIRFGSGLMALILVPHGRRLRVPVDKIRLHAVCRRPKCQRDLLTFVASLQSPKRVIGYL